MWRLFQVTAMNHVSTLTEHFNVTVDRLQPMANLTVRGVPDVVPQGSTQTLTTSVLVDMSVAATFRYEQMDRITDYLDRSMDVIVCGLFKNKKKRLFFHFVSSAFYA